MAFVKGFVITTKDPNGGGERASRSDAQIRQPVLRQIADLLSLHAVPPVVVPPGDITSIQMPEVIQFRSPE
jgi:hypothetical protein